MYCVKDLHFTDIEKIKSQSIRYVRIKNVEAQLLLTQMKIFLGK